MRLDLWRNADGLDGNSWFTFQSRRLAPPQKTKLKQAIGPGLLLLFIIGDVLGTGIYALTGKVAAHVGGIVWLSFLAAFIVAALTAVSYMELVTKSPKAAGAALHAEKAFGIHFVTFLVAFAACPRASPPRPRRRAPLPRTFRQASASISMGFGSPSSASASSPRSH